MSKPRYRWWGYVKAVIRAYPALDKVMREPIYTPTTARYSTQPPQAGDGRSLECAVVKRLTGRDVEEYEAVSAAQRQGAPEDYRPGLLAGDAHLGGSWVAGGV